VKKLIDLFIEKTAWVNGITIAITVAGLVALYGMKRDLHPPFKFNYVKVNLTYQYGSAEEIERLITYPLEEALRDIPGVEEITSRTKVGGTSIILKFPTSVKNLPEKIEEARSRIMTQTRYLPKDIREVTVTQVSDNEIFVANLGITGIDPQNWDHHRFLEYLKNKIRVVPGINNVQNSMPSYHLFIRFDKDKLARNGVTVAQIRSAVLSELEGNVIGFNSSNGKEWLLEFAQNSVTPDVIAAIPLFRNSQGFGLKLGDVADVKFDLEKNEKYHFLLNGKKAVEMTVTKAPERDSMATFADLKKVLAETDKPQGVDIRVLYDSPYFVQQQISVLTSNGFGGLLLVLLMLTVAMGFKTSLMTALGLPISYFGTFLILRALGISIDLISMIAMILVVGNLVDDAVIFAERYNQLLVDGREPKVAASEAANELIVPVSGTILTIIFAFIPILVIDSELSIVFFAIPIVVSVALLLSWFETFFILPNHLSHFVKKPTATRATNFFHFLARIYKRALTHTLRFRYLYGMGAIALLGYSLFTASKMPQDFSLSINAPQVEVFVTMKDELSFEQVEKILKPLHTELLTIPKDKLDFIETNLGWIWREGKSYRGSKYATVRLVLNREEVDVRSLREDVHARVNEAIKNFKPPEIHEVVAVASERGANSRRKDLATVEIRGRDERAFRIAEQEVIQLVAGQKNVGEYVPPDDLGPTTYQFFANNQAMRGFQIPREDLAFQVQAQTGSVELLQTRDGNRWMRVYIEPNRLKEPTVQDLKALTVQSPKHGDIFSIRSLGEWKPAGFSQGIEHKNSARVLTLDFRYDGKKTNEQVVKADMQELIKPLGTKYPGLEFKIIDSNEEDKKGREWTGKIVLAAAILIYLILVATLRSWSEPLIVGLPIPFAFIGVVWALKLHDLPLGLMAMIGLIGTMGVAVNDSIVMVHHINKLWRENGRRTAQLVIDGAASRLRAIFLTASCTLVGVFPTAYGVGGESGFTQPLAFAMGWGLTASLLLTLFIIPAMLMVLEDIRTLPSRVKTRFAGKHEESVQKKGNPKEPDSNLPDLSDFGSNQEL
jgi:multidrug efflux pump subunit AcrB